LSKTGPFYICWQAVLIGMRTRKIVFVGSRNKYCYICAVAKKRKVEIPTHKCYKNYEGPPTGMEQDIIIEGINAIHKMHNVSIEEYLGDGDSSVIARIKERCNGGYRVVKVPCKNHAIRVYCYSLYGLANNNKAFPLVEARNKLKNNIPRLVKMANCAIATATKNKTSPKEVIVKQLRHDLEIGPYHVFGQHQKCGTWCKVKLDVSSVKLLEQAGMWKEILKKRDYLTQLAENLRSDRNTNPAECFMAVNNKIQGSKRINQAYRGAFHGRTLAAVLKFNYGHLWSHLVLKSKLGHTPYKVLKDVSFRRSDQSRLNRKNCIRRLEAHPEEKARKKGGGDSSGDCEYGKKAAKPDIDETEMQKLKFEKIEELKQQTNTLDKRRKLSKITKGQFQCPRYIAEKRFRLSSSRFGQVVKMRASTLLDSILKSFIAPADLSKQSAIIYGIANEDNARRKYTYTLGPEVKEYGLQTNFAWPSLAASPDGFVGKYVIIEIKCFESVGDMKILDFVAELQGLDENQLPIYIDGVRKAKSKKFASFCMEIQEETRELRLKRNSNYYYQIQGQLAITEKKFCDFVVYTEKDFFVERIQFDEDLWKNVMLPKLEWFYMECLLPELLDSRILRGMKVRPPGKPFTDNMKVTKKKPQRR
jgi:YqaJ-like viral recombinase domain